MTNTGEFPVWLEVPHGARFLTVGEFPQAVAAAILRSRADATELERSTLTDEWAGRLAAEIERGTIGVHDATTEERMSEPPIGDELRISKIRIQVIEALLAPHRIGLKFIGAESVAAPQLPTPLDAIAAAMAREKELAAMTQEARRKALDAAGLTGVSAAPKPLSAIPRTLTSHPSAPPPVDSMRQRRDRKRGIVSVAGPNVVQRRELEAPEPVGVDWSLWANIPQPEIWQAVALSLDIDPNTLPGVVLDGHGIAFTECAEPFRTRLWVATQNAEAGTLAAINKGADPAEWPVRLDIFRAWAERLPKPWQGFPQDFPSARAESANPARPDVSGVDDGGSISSNEVANSGAIQEFKPAARDEMGELIERIVAERPAASESEVWRELLALAKAPSPPCPLLEVVDGEIKWRNSSTDKVTFMSRRTFKKRWDRR